VETLWQFYGGIEQTPNRPRNGWPTPHGQHFIYFFLGSKHFSTAFDTMEGDLFYKHFRCGVLHQAQTKKKSRIRIGLPGIVQYADSSDQQQGLVLDRVRLHSALLAEIDDYGQLLRALQRTSHEQKRTNFITKWTYIVP
jgi:hypothetical protein